MRVLIATAGSHGDVVPYTGLGLHLQSAGHQVTVATHTRSAELVRRCGLCFHPLPLDDHAMGERVQGPQEGGGGRLLSPVQQIRLARHLAPQMADALADACACGVEVLLVSGSLAPLGVVASLGLRLPSMGVFLQPLAPTREFPPVVLGTRPLGRLGNLTAGYCAQSLLSYAFTPGVRHLRSRLRVNAQALHSRWATWPIYHGFSPTVVPRPVDWRPGMQVTGYWWPPRIPEWKPEPRLADFLRSGPPPVYVGFGSMPVGDPEPVGRCVARALKLAKVRGIVQTGSAGLSIEGDDVLTIGEVPHAQLFPRMSAVVHHAGAGTTAAGLRAGVPSVPVPVMLDQPFWASRLVALDVSPASIPLRRLSAEDLACAIRKAVHDPRYHHRARRLAASINAEDGAGPVLAAVERLADEGQHR